MNRYAAQVLCLILLLWPMSLLADGTARFYGVWAGRVTEILTASDAVLRYDVTIEIVPGQARVDYPGLGCRGILLLRRWGGRYLGFQDRLDYGAERCESRGRTELFLVNSGLAAYLWFDAQGQLKAGGYLRRQQQLAVLSKQGRRQAADVSERQGIIGW